MAKFLTGDTVIRVKVNKEVEVGEVVKVEKTGSRFDHIHYVTEGKIKVVREDFLSTEQEIKQRSKLYQNASDLLNQLNEIKELKVI